MQRRTGVTVDSYKGKTWHHRICQYICGTPSNPNTAFCPLNVFLSSCFTCFSSSLSHFFIPQVHTEPQLSTVLHRSPVTALWRAAEALDGKRKGGEWGREEEEKKKGRWSSEGDEGPLTSLLLSGTERRAGEIDSIATTVVRYWKLSLWHPLLAGKHLCVCIRCFPATWLWR